MSMKMKKAFFAWGLPSLAAAIVFFFSQQIIEVNNYVSAGLLVLLAIGNYAYFARISGKNYLDYRAIFSGFWLGTIGLAALRLTEYQVPWVPLTWVCLCLGYIVFILGLNLSAPVLQAVSTRWDPHRFKLFSKGGRLKLEMQQSRLFWACLIVSGICVACFCYNVWYRGYIPFFNNNPWAYTEFHTAASTFMHSATVVSGLCYYCIKKVKLSWLQKGILLLCIFFLVFFMPIMVVSRGIFLTSSLSLAAAVFYLNQRRFWVLFCSFLVIFGGYELGGIARKLSDDYLNEVFEPRKIVIAEETNNEEGNIIQRSQSFQLPARVVFLYTYLTVGHDNFDQAVRKSERYSYGALQLEPFNVILRSSAIREMVDNAEERYTVQLPFNTISLFGDAYYDFHLWGLLFFALLWGLCFGFVERFYLKFRGAFSLMALGNTLTPVALCFFESWMGTFSLWTQWGTILLVFLACCIGFRKKTAVQEEENTLTEQE